ncbi:MAG: ATP-dependent DNA helicase, partial [Gammaproteobacteria bacterium]|nr:ATP-dependent DNA helicase [Gammaproteobacteria bacterium]
AAVSRLREVIAVHLDEASGAPETAMMWLTREVGIGREAARQIVTYLAAGKAALGVMPSQSQIVLERFFDESGGMQLVIHAPFGSRINRAWGLALRKRFCRRFNFELQAAASEDAIVISLGETHSFPLDEVPRYLDPKTVRGLLVQALLNSPMFAIRWRWNLGVALAVLRFAGGKKVPAPLRRMQAEDLLAVIFPDCLACQENLQGERAIPDHPLVNQTVHDGLYEAMDIEGLERLLLDLDQGTRSVHVRELTEPSPLAQEILTARPYAYLDDAPLEERRTQAVMSRRWLDAQSASDLGKLDGDAIARVKEEVWPEVNSTDELHDALLLLGAMTEGELAAQGPHGEAFIAELIAEKRATLLLREPASSLWVAAERLPMLLALYPNADLAPPIAAPAEYAAIPFSFEAALVELLRGRLGCVGPETAAHLAGLFGLHEQAVETALKRLEGEGFLLRGRFTPGFPGTEWCERRLLARIHRYTVARLRAEIEPVASADFMRFLLDWQHVAPRQQGEGPQALAAILDQLEGFEAPACAWEGEILPCRVSDYEPAWLDQLCLAGRILWARGRLRVSFGPKRTLAPVRSTPITFLSRGGASAWQGLVPLANGQCLPLSNRARQVALFLEKAGASFFADLVDGTGLLGSELEEALGELVGAGLVHSDSFAGLRALLLPSNRRRPFSGVRRRRRVALFGIEEAGRWVRRFRPVDGAAPDGDTEGAGPPAMGLSFPSPRVAQIARTLLRRYGVVFRRLVAREGALPPWRELWLLYRQLEARGEIRGGRFVAGASGEQFALPEAVGALREVRRQEKTGTLVSISAADPLNLVGIVTPGARVPALVGNRVLYRDGVPIAVQLGKAVELLEPHPGNEAWQVRNALLKRAVSPELRSVLRQMG